MIYQLSTLWLLLTAAAALEVYNEGPGEKNEVLSQDTDAVAMKTRADESRLQDFQEDQEARRRRHTEQAEFDDMENSAMKRVALAPERSIRSLRLWETKKGSGVGSQGCYFKLCGAKKPV